MPTIDQARTIEAMWEAGKSVSHISRVTRLSHAETRRYIHDHASDCHPREQLVFNATERQFIEIAWNNGVTIDRICEALNVTRASITRYVGTHRDICPNKDIVKRRLSAKKKAIAAAEKAEREANKKMHKISADVIDQIIEAHEKGLSNNQIAKKLGVGATTAGRYARKWELEQAQI